MTRSTLLAVTIIALSSGWPGASQAANPYRGAGDPLEDPWDITLADGKLRLTPHLQYWVRGEVDGAKDLKPDTNNEFVVHRARLGLRVDAIDALSIFVQLQDVRRWGEEANTLDDFSADGLDVHQAWAELRHTAWGLRARIGRQELSYDGHRLIGNVMWLMQARSFDAILLAFERGALAVHTFWARLAESDAPTSPHNFGADLAGLWANYAGLPFFRPSLYLLYDRSSLTDRHRVTLGLYAKGKPLPKLGLGYEAEFYYQLGQTDSGAVQEADIAALLAAFRLSYTSARLPARPMLMAFFDYLSGDDDPGDDKVGVFDTLFATNHKFYGFADMFLNIPAHTGGKGLMDFGGRLKLAPLRGAAVLLDFHHFRLAEPFDSAGREVSAVGNEVDLVVTYTPVVKPQLSFQAGFSVFLPELAGACVARGGADCQVQGDGTAADAEYFAYAMMNLSFN